MKNSHLGKEQRGEEPSRGEATCKGREAERAWHSPETVRRAARLEPSEQGGEGQERRVEKPLG